jgi:uncharacterized membrane protein
MALNKQLEGEVGIGLFIVTALLVAAASLVRLKRRKTLTVTSAEPSLDVTLWVRIVVSLAVLVCALYVISNQFGNEQQKWASGSIGTILGYWLKV